MINNILFLSSLQAIVLTDKGALVEYSVRRDAAGFMELYSPKPVNVAPPIAGQTTQAPS